MDGLAPFIGVAAFALVAYVVFRLIRGERERRAARRHEAAAHGFAPVSPPDPDTVARITALHRRYEGQQLEIRHLYRKATGAHTLYLFDLADTTPESTDMARDRAVAVRSGALRLPRFSLTPRIEQEGQLARLGNWLLQQFAPRGGQRVEFPSAPGFDERYTLTADDETAARRFFTGERLARLAETRHWMVEGEGDMFTVEQLVLLPAASRGRPDLAARLQDAERALEIFTSG